MSTQLLIRPAMAAGRTAVWEVLEPAVRPAPEEDGRVVGTYDVSANQKGAGDHVANAGYATDPAWRGRGIARAMVEHLLRASASARVHRDAVQFRRQL